MINFHDVRLPQHLAIFAVGVSEFSTSIASSKSGREVRNLDNNEAKKRYLLKDCLLSPAQFEEFNAFFKARGGRRYSFRLKDFADFKADKSPIAKGDGVQKEFFLKKTYKDKVNPYIRDISKPVAKSIKVWIGNQEEQGYIFDYDSGKLIFNSAPSQGAAITSSFEFDIPVRFADDSFAYSFCDDGSIKLENIELLEVSE